MNKREMITHFFQIDQIQVFYFGHSIVIEDLL